MKYSDAELEKILEKLIDSTRSPRKQFSAAAGYPRIEKKLFHRKRRQWLGNGLAIAASVALVCLSAWMVFYYLQSTQIQKVSTMNSIGIVHLPDGTKVTLNHHSSLSYPKHFKRKNRTVTLTGEAFFDVKKDKRHPFIVETEAIRVQVLGTLFNINAYKNNSCIETTLLEGSVAVGNREKTDCLILKPNEKAIYNKVGGRLIRKIAENSAIDIAWIHGELIFESTPLKEIIQELGNRFNVDIVIADTAIQNYRITARFPNEETLETILSVLHKAGYFDYTLNNGKIILTTNPTNQ
ncbi:FecR family protein [Bacteroides pyogenes]|jgi:transmembrane sensor|uniref:DUF4974 domain-containing protein n=3 Tax=Bacteroides pyogenes TaxID=310300 RepID=A0A5D3ETU7_9BACE|nr:FecR domain-containing protein [Bacteroides pyogenes]GAE16078.1 putative anti-sigma factor [Bacteroides pyogenes JCM 6292]MBR8704721.1 hypothetical protein [Bacteroides pyogenes]MBR8707279.1 hypothetical protein [Bacteroides pyogenes]MBR8717129.1 hypothetical protein [Bacteroides pyogenes]MBR8745876.1 hypothetical protein [Bacteroides pyogenes]